VTSSHVEAIRPPFSALVAKFPRKSISRAELYSEIGPVRLLEETGYRIEAVEKVFEPV